MALMGSEIIQLMLVLILHLSLRYHGAEGGQRSFNDEDLEMDNQLRVLNKPPVKTFKTKEGEKFDCIDIYKQPAFDNPLLKNHKIQMRPSVHSESSSRGATNDQLLNEVLQRFDCPNGTVPIRRTSKEDLIRAKSFSQLFNGSRHSIRPAFFEMPYQHVAMLYSADNVPHAYYGVYGDIDTANPKVGNDQISSAQLWIESGPMDDTNSLQAGWMVAPPLFGDNKTRIFTYWHGVRRSGCYNTLCRGFVQIDKYYTIGSVILTISKYRGTQYRLKTLIFQDKSTGNWWLTYGEVPNVTHIGYWPESLFPNMKRGTGASFVAWGGFVKTPIESQSNPEMGNGHFPHDEQDYSCTIRDLEVANPNNQIYKMDSKDLRLRVDSSADCYRATYDGSTFFFGGPGGPYCFY